MENKGMQEHLISIEVSWKLKWFIQVTVLTHLSMQKGYTDGLHTSISIPA